MDTASRYGTWLSTGATLPYWMIQHPQPTSVNDKTIEINHVEWKSKIHLSLLQFE
jgi:hypothetical protein